ncbi:MAG: hypothetical protein ACTSRA_00935 [Promethearchaeota archaeon]|nr:MAG: glycosyltransferase family 2/hexosyltransferase with Elf1-like domain protein [Helarchaeota virus Nidhogg Meg22_1012]URC17343.1 MAG: glycosyltransferase family 2/hexosyltransferase with Elf1-like domain protein [Helarchaeota virus Nidhogg Meg22_1214]
MTKRKKKRKNKKTFKCPNCHKGNIHFGLRTDYNREALMAKAYCNNCNLMEIFEYKNYFGSMLRLEEYDIYGDLIDRVKKTTKITFYQILKDEWNTIYRTIRQVARHVDEVMILHETDYPFDFDVSLYVGMPIKFIKTSFNGSFSELRNFAASIAKHEWLFTLDADETMEYVGRKNLKSLIEQNPDNDAFYFRRINEKMFDYPDWQCRLYKKSLTWSRPVHEVLSPKNPVYTRYNIIHHGNMTMEKMKFYDYLHEAEDDLKDDLRRYLRVASIGNGK